MSSPTEKPSPPPQARPEAAKGDSLTTSLALLLITAAVFWPVLKTGFVNYDDPVFVLQNPMVQKGINAETLRWAFSSLYIYWQPLTWISYMVDHSIGGASPVIFHATNLVLHLASSVVLFVALRRMTGFHWRSAMVAALFALHPLHVETVAWVSERKGALSGFFWCLTLLAYSHHARKPRWATLTAVSLCFALGVMSKSIVVTLPFVLLLLDFWPLNRWRNFPANPGGIGNRFPASSATQLILEKVPLFVIAAVSSWLTIAAQKKMGAVMSTAMFSIGDRLAIVTTSYLGYLRKLFWPSDLTVFYPNPGTWPKSEVVLASVILMGITAVSLWQWKQRRYLAIGWFLYLGILLPVSGILQTGEQLMADRYSYLPTTGLFIMLVWLAAELGEKLAGARIILGAVAGLTALACAAGSAMQLSTWQSTRALFEQANRVTSDNHLAHTVLGTLDADERKFEEAMAHFEAALKIQPRYAETHHRMAMAFLAQNKFNDAIPHLQAALKEDPSNPDILLTLGNALVAKGDPASAEGIFNQLLQARPRSAGLLQSLATILHQQKKYREAIQRYRECVSIDPSRVEALNNLAWILATHSDPALRNGTEAVQLAEQGCKITSRKVPIVIGTLAAAYAEAGRFQDAARATEEAEKLARDAGQKEVATRNAELRALYLSEKPWREANP